MGYQARGAKFRMILTVAGPQAVEVFNTFVFANEDESEQFNKVV